MELRIGAGSRLSPRNNNPNKKGGQCYEKNNAERGNGRFVASVSPPFSRRQAGPCAAAAG